MLRQRLREQGPALLAIAIPVLAGIGWMALANAPSHYLVLNAAVLVASLVLITLLPALHSVRMRRAAIIVLIALLFVPMLTGPEVNDISRWLPIGPVQLHSGMLVIPALAVLAAREPGYAEPILLAATFAALVQPDSASAFAVMGAGVGLYFASPHWRPAVVAVLAFAAALLAAMNGELPAQPFVERVLADAAQQNPFVAIGLLLSWVAAFMIILKATALEKAERFALAGTLFGFAMMGTISNYPSLLIGYGAAPILGYGLALGLARARQ